MVPGGWIGRRQHNRPRRRVTSYERRRHTDLSSGSNPIDLVIGIAAEYLIFSGRHCVTWLRRGSGPYIPYSVYYSFVLTAPRFNREYTPRSARLRRDVSREASVDELQRDTKLLASRTTETDPMADEEMRQMRHACYFLDTESGTLCSLLERRNSFAGSVASTKQEKTFYDPLCPVSPVADPWGAMG